MSRLFLIARIAGRGVALPTDRVISVVDLGEIVSVPGASAAVLGLAALRSRVVTVVDPAVVLGGDRGEGDGRAVIVSVEGHEYALVVDDLEDVAPFEMLPLSSGLTLGDGWARAAAGLIERDGEPLLVLDVAALLPVMATAA